MRTEGFGFSSEEIAACAQRRGLLSMELEFSLACNFRCPYCYSDAKKSQHNLSVEEFKNAILQAVELGARRFIILGGEPMIYPHLREMIDFMRERNLEIEMFTNGTGMTPEAARYMFERQVMVVLKLNTLDREMQNRLTGIENGYEIIHSALANLKAAGYPSPGRPMAISTVICTGNVDEIPTLWRWIRDQGALPYVEVITPQGGAKQNHNWLDVPIGRIKETFDTLARIDREEYGNEWAPQPPLVGNVCRRHLFSAVLCANGNINSCVGVNIPLGNIREQPLAQILRDSEVLENLRNHRSKIKEPCRSCEKAENCYGCRGAAYQMTGDYLAADPLCWKVDPSKVEYLPLEVEHLIPHGRSMRMVDRLVKVGERNADAEFTVRADSVFVDENGVLDETMYVEMVAQALAACHGFHLSADEQKLHRGFLLQVKDVQVHGQAKAGDLLRIHVRKLTRFGNFGVADGTVRARDGRVLARCELKLWQSSEEPEPAAAGAVAV